MGGAVDSDDPLMSELYGLEGCPVVPDEPMLYVADGNRGEAAVQPRPPGQAALAMSARDRRPRRRHPAPISRCPATTPDPHVPRARVRGRWAGRQRPIEAAALRRAPAGWRAGLVVVSPARVWRVRADDPLRTGRGAGDALAAEVAAASDGYGVRPGDDAVFVIDGRGVVRFTRRSTGDGDGDPDGSAGGDRSPVGPPRRRVGRWAGARDRRPRGARARARRPPARAVHPARGGRACWWPAAPPAPFLAGCRNRSAPDRRGAGAEAARPTSNRRALRINGKPHRLTLVPRTSLLDALRERIG
jgi:hypothetical protein